VPPIALSLVLIGEPARSFLRHVAAPRWTAALRRTSRSTRSRTTTLSVRPLGWAREIGWPRRLPCIRQGGIARHVPSHSPRTLWAAFGGDLSKARASTVLIFFIAPGSTDTNSAFDHTAADEEEASATADHRRPFPDHRSSTKREVDVRSQRAHPCCCVAICKAAGADGYSSCRLLPSARGDEHWRASIRCAMAVASPPAAAT
jgi:hypothetical protein